MRLEATRNEWDRALRSLKAAEVLIPDGLTEDAVSRAYYSILHAAKAALLVSDVAADTHAAVRRMFGQVLVKPGIIEPEWADILSEAQEERETADYDVASRIDPQIAGRIVSDAGRFLERMHRYLEANGVALG